jgi:hypothetical protein
LAQAASSNRHPPVIRNSAAIIDTDLLKMPSSFHLRFICALSGEKYCSSIHGMASFWSKDIDIKTFKFCGTRATVLISNIGVRFIFGNSLQVSCSMDYKTFSSISVPELSESAVLFTKNDGSESIVLEARPSFRRILFAWIGQLESSYKS